MPYRLIKTMDGRRGGFLLLAALGYVVIGIVNVTTKTSMTADLAFGWLPAHLSSKSLGWLWIIIGLVMVITSLVSASHSKLESAGYVVSLIPPFTWAFVFSTSQLFGNPYGVRGGAVYFLISILMYYTAGWPNNITLRKESADAPTA